MHAGFVGIFIPEHLLSALTEKPDGKPLPGGIRVQNIPQGPRYFARFAGYITLKRRDMDQFTSALDSAIRSGLSLETGLAKLRVQGATPVEAIKAIHFSQGVGLAEAKRIFDLSPAWTREAAAGSALHEEVIGLLDSEAKQ